jgi:hypothetical protein
MPKPTPRATWMGRIEDKFLELEHEHSLAKAELKKLTSQYYRANDELKHLECSDEASEVANRLRYLNRMYEGFPRDENGNVTSTNSFVLKYPQLVNDAQHDYLDRLERRKKNVDTVHTRLTETSKKVDELQKQLTEARKPYILAQHRNQLRGGRRYTRKAQKAEAKAHTYSSHNVPDTIST